MKLLRTPSLEDDAAASEASDSVVSSLAFKVPVSSNVTAYTEGHLRQEAKRMAKDAKAKLIGWDVRVSNHGASLGVTVEAKDGVCSYLTQTL